MFQIISGRALSLPSCKQSDYHAVTLPTGKAYFTAINFVELGDEELTLSETYAKAEWGRLLPEPAILEHYISSKLLDSSSKYTNTINIVNGFCSFLFLASAIGLFIRFLRFVTTPSLNSNEDNYESARVFTDVLGYFLAPFILTLTSAIVNYMILRAKKKDTNQLIKLALIIYAKSRSQLITTHNMTYEFFALTELIADLSPIRLEQVDYYYKIRDIEDKLKRIFRITHSVEYKQYFSGEIYIQDLHPLEIIKRLRAILLGSRFSYFVKQIKYHINKIFLKKATGQEYSELREYLPKIASDPPMQIILLDIIGLISKRKSQATPTVLLTPIQLTEHEAMEPIAKAALNQYWNNPDISKPFIHPYSIDLKELANLIILELRLLEPGHHFASRHRHLAVSSQIGCLQPIHHYYRGFSLLHAATITPPDQADHTTQWGLS